MRKFSTTGAVLFPGDDGDVEFVSAFQQFFFFQHDGATGFEDEGGRTLRVEIVDGGDANGRDVKAHILVGVGGLAEDPAFAFAEFGGSLDEAIGAFDGFDGDDFAVLAGEGLADEEFVEAFEEGPGEVDVGLGGCVGLGAGEDTGGSE